MTLCIAARAGDSVVCATDLAVSYGENRFQNPTIKGLYKDGDFVMYAGDCWVAHEILWRQGPFLEVRKDVWEENKEEFRGDFPAEFLVTTEEGLIYIAGSHEVFGPFPDYACIGGGSDLGWALLDALYKRIRVPTVGAVKRVIGEIYSIVGQRREGVSTNWKSVVV